MRIACLIVFLCAAAAPAASQVSTRAGQIQAEREAKAGRLEPDRNSGAERALLFIKDTRLLDRFTAGVYGFRLKFGGLATGSGFALGPEYLRSDLADGQLLFRGSAQASLKKYQLFDLQLAAPQLADGRVFFDLSAMHRNFPRTQYYGPGPDSQKGARSNFRLEDTSYAVMAGVRPLRHLQLAGTAGYLQVNVGPGTDPRFISSERIFSTAQAPGIDVQTDFLRYGALIQYDYRDNAGGPRRGGNYVARYERFGDRGLDLHSFGRLDLDAQQYIPFFNARRVIALRAKSVLTYADSGHRVPFHLQPTLGGSDDLRGFRPFRFYDDNMVVFNAEYRWETFSGLDMAIFADAGKVFSRRSQWNVHDLEGSVGVGLRFNVRNSVFLRVDAGFSHEGFQVWVKFNNVF